MTTVTLGESKWTNLSSIRAVLLAGLAAGLVDAGYFSVGAMLKGNSPVQVLKGIAGFWFDKNPLDSASTAVLGAVTHFALAMLMAAGFVLLRPVVPWLRGSALRAGLVWGVALYLIMYLVVLPLRWPGIFPRWDGWTSIFDILVHLAVGVTIAAIVGRQAPWRGA